MDAFAQTCELIAKYGGRLKKVATLAAYLRTLDDADFERAVRFLASGPASKDGKRLSIGHATLRDPAMQVSGWDAETLRVCYQTVGDTGETIAKLLAGHTKNEPLSLAEADAIYQRLFRTRRTAERFEILREAFTSYRPETLKFFIKVITGNLRIGLQEKMVEEAVAAATGVAAQEIRDANNRMGDLAKVAMAARSGELHAIEARLFHAMDFMLAKPLDEPSELANPEQYFVEDKYDGIRAQAHVEHGRVALFTRGLEDVTHSYPEVVTALQFLPGDSVMDGELIAWRNGRSLAFTVLQQRLARKKLTPQILEEIPVVFIAYDLLYRSGELLLETPIEKRRALLEELVGQGNETILLSPQHVLASAEEIEQRFEQSRGRGNEGLLLKRRGSAYEPGRRSGSWYKVKKAYGTLDVVITAAEQGHGKRATMLSDYTFAVRMGDRFVNVGKAYSGLTDVEIRELTRLLKASATDRFGRVMLVKPEIVLEVAFDGVQKSPRHKSGYALRFPRILRWRQDKAPEQADDIERVKALYDASLHAEQS